MVGGIAGVGNGIGPDSATVGFDCSSLVQYAYHQDEPAVWVQEERDYYGDCESTNRFAVGRSRVWVEQYVSSTTPAEDPGSVVWLDNLNRDPNTPELRTLHSVQGHPDPVGARLSSLQGTASKPIYERSARSA